MYRDHAKELLWSEPTSIVSRTKHCQHFTSSGQELNFCSVCEGRELICCFFLNRRSFCEKQVSASIFFEVEQNLMNQMLIFSIYMDSICVQIAQRCLRFFACLFVFVVKSISCLLCCEIARDTVRNCVYSTFIFSYPSMVGKVLFPGQVFESWVD